MNETESELRRTTESKSRVVVFLVLIVKILGAVLTLCILLVLGLLISGAMYSEPMRMYPERAEGIRISTMGEWGTGEGRPKDVELMRSTNNVDLIRVGNSIYMAFRTAPTHFASPRTKLYVVRSDDEGKTWEKELCLGLGRDIREPRFLYFRDRLLLYFFTGGTNPIGFEPDYIHYIERSDSGHWTEPKPIFKPGYVVWRVRAKDDKAYMSVYYGAELYSLGEKGEVRLLVSSDGEHWEPISDRPQVDKVGAEEAEFVFDESGGIVAIVRLERTGGGLICRAPAERIDCWECKFTPYKVDSSLMFTHNGKFFVIGRRNIAGVSARRIPFAPESISNGWSMLFYSLTRKRTCLYEIDADRLELYPLMDFDSKGDTAFAGIVQLSKNRYYVVNYSSPLDGMDLPWILGQIWGSRLYGYLIEFPE